MIKKMRFLSIPMILGFSVIVLFFQNCATQYDIQMKDGTAESVSSESVEREPAAERICLDKETGVTHKEGEKWIIKTPSQESVACPDKSTITKKYISSTSYLCTNEIIVPGATEKEAVLPIPVCPTVIPDCAAPGTVNCPTPVLTATLDTSTPRENVINNLNVTSKNVTMVSYACRPMNSALNFAQGNLSVGDQVVPIKFTSDSVCDVTAKTSMGMTIKASVTAIVDCSTRIKEGGSCRDFTCLKTESLVLDDAKRIYDIPARSNEGICYAIKIINKLALGKSTLTQQRDTTVESRDHSNGASNPNLVAAPYLMGNKVINIKLLGDRRIKLAGGASDQAPILVDNYILVGIFPSSITTLSASYYNAYGTSDSTITKAGSSSILLNQNPVKLQPFGTGGTSTVKALDVTTQVTPMNPYFIDVRAEDCGGARELSDIYLFFQ